MLSKRHAVTPNITIYYISIFNIGRLWYYIVSILAIGTNEKWHRIICKYFCLPNSDTTELIILSLHLMTLGYEDLSTAIWSFNPYGLCLLPYLYGIFIFWVPTNKYFGLQYCLIIKPSGGNIRKQKGLIYWCQAHRETLRIKLSVLKLSI